MKRWNSFFRPVIRSVHPSPDSSSVESVADNISLTTEPHSHSPSPSTSPLLQLTSSSLSSTAPPPKKKVHFSESPTFYEAEVREPEVPALEEIYTRKTPTPAAPVADNVILFDISYDMFENDFADFEPWTPPDKYGLENSDFIIPSIYTYNKPPHENLDIDFLQIIKKDIMSFRVLNEYQMKYIDNLDEYEKFELLKLYNKCMMSLTDIVEIDVPVEKV